MQFRAAITSVILSPTEHTSKWGVCGFFSQHFFHILSGDDCFNYIVRCCRRLSAPMLFTDKTAYICYPFFPLLVSCVWMHTDSAAWVDVSPGDRRKAPDCLWISCSWAAGPVCQRLASYMQHSLLLEFLKNGNLLLQYHTRVFIIVLKWLTVAIQMSCRDIWRGILHTVPYFQGTLYKWAMFKSFIVFTQCFFFCLLKVCPGLFFPKWHMYRPN